MKEPVRPGPAAPATRQPPGAAALPDELDRLIGARSWSLAFRSTIGFDSNPSLTPEDDLRDAGGGLFVQQQVFGTVRLWQSNGFSVHAGGQAFVTYPTEAPDFAAAAVRPNLRADYRFQIRGAPARISVGYGLDATFQDGRSFNTGHAVTTAFTVEPILFLKVRTFYRFEAITFEQGARNARRHTIGISFSAPLAAGAWGVATGSLGYAWTRNDARTNEFTHHRHSVSVGANVLLRPGLLSLVPGRRASLWLSVGYSNAPYAASAVRPSRRDQAVFVRVGYRTPVWRNLAAEVSVSHRQVTSSSDRFATGRTVVSLSFVWRF